MNREQLQIVQRSFGAFGWPTSVDGHADQSVVIETEGDHITIGNGLLWISETSLQHRGVLTFMPAPMFKLEISKIRPGGPEPDDHDLHFIAEERTFPAIVVRAIGCYAEYKAQGIMEELATEAAVKQYDEWHDGWREELL